MKYSEIKRNELFDTQNNLDGFYIEWGNKRQFLKVHTVQFHLHNTLQMAKL